MKLFEKPGLLLEIEDLLDQERTAIAHADYARLAALAPRKERLLARLSDTPAPAEERAIDRIRRAAQQNQRMIAASLRGLQSAKSRFEAIQAAQTSLNTYDDQGRRKDIPMAGGALEHRV